MFFSARLDLLPPKLARDRQEIVKFESCVGTRPKDPVEHGREPKHLYPGSDPPSTNKATQPSSMSTTVRNSKLDNRRNMGLTHLSGGGEYDPVYIFFKKCNCIKSLL